MVNDFGVLRTDEKYIEPTLAVGRAPARGMPHP